MVGPIDLGSLAFDVRLVSRHKYGGGSVTRKMTAGCIEQSRLLPHPKPRYMSQSEIISHSHVTVSIDDQNAISGCE
eukprot:g44745.t1